MPPEMLWFRWFAKTYGWTPDQVRDLDLDFFEWLPVIEAADHQAGESRRKTEDAKQRRPRGGY